MTLLIVDDNQAMRQLITKVVCDLAETCHECSDGAQALAAYREHRPDWVLMDIEMKVMNGLTATRQLTAVFPEARIMIVTQYDDTRLRELAREAGACGYVVKENLLQLRQLLAQEGPFVQESLLTPGDAPKH
jgi:CheY-like chemotaxis protein